MTEFSGDGWSKLN